MTRISTMGLAAALATTLFAGEAWSAEISPMRTVAMNPIQPAPAISTVLVAKKAPKPGDLVGLNPQPEPPSFWRLIQLK